MLKITDCKSLDKKYLNGLIQEFLNRKSYAKDTKATYKKQLKVFFSYCATKKIKKPRRKDILSFLEHLIYSGKSASYINNLLTSLRVFFKYLDYLGLYPDITKMIDRVKSDKRHKREALYPFQFIKILNAMPDTDNEISLRNYAIINLLGRTGIRRNGLRELQIKHLYEKAGHDQQQAWYLLIKLKGHQVSTHELYLTPKSVDPIQNYLKLKKKQKKNDYLFSTQSGKQLNVDFISRLFKKSARRVGIDTPKITCHSLRHMFATIAKEKGEALEDISDVLGHANFATTSDIYVHRGDSNKSRVLKVVDEVLDV
ncbi:MAG: tyrosine-type recombinase/integrase [Candidatus Cloacimonetes bacterium]|nr:tyrosine-type recombinase/integrase [Candidatus Cloacimonadota bacterium]